MVPYNTYFSAKFQSHINFEICSGVRAVKYIYKYVCKGHDRIVAQVSGSENEVSKFRDAIWIAAHEACWRIFGFDHSIMYPAVHPLDIHLPDQHRLTFRNDQSLAEIQHQFQSAYTELLAYFERNRVDPSPRDKRLIDFPQFYTWCWNSSQTSHSSSCNPLW